ncbi:hypothetical protein Pla123a_47010 [Posidoniimonas polymericola]|uniref:Pilus assembly protein, PilP n=1 Tax=Posidoniimonas polymericola TaxID=2528002 RepID=A0A5C5XST9_9BACT|nr:hypothetical protein [Posidoniimonas polymericola]TWT66307.1 hypothetical protein Pla123a_47010 [Posidoniimonas polymericola]
MPLPLHKSLAAAAVAMLVVAGCAEEPAPLPTLPTPVREPSTRLPETPDDAEATPHRVAQWTPPYPQREELFAPPQRSRSTARRSGGGDDDESVQLIGFVTVDEIKAVLSIDGVIASVAAGTQKYGIEVIAITPPEVVLQRGRNRWTASLD